MIHSLFIINNTGYIFPLVHVEYLSMNIVYNTAGLLMTALPIVAAASLFMPGDAVYPTVIGVFDDLLLSASLFTNYLQFGPHEFHSKASSL